MTKPITAVALMMLIEKLDIYAYHGFFSEEERLGQRFVLDLALEVDLRASAISDALPIREKTAPK